MAEDTGAKTLVIPQLLVGLGNPGSKYDRTRHNVGFDVVDALTRIWQISLSENKRFQGMYGETTLAPGGKIRLLKPQTYMNRSGQAIRATIDWYKLPPQSVLVIYDDLDLPLGRMRLRLSGSAGSHNGMKSAIAHLGGQNFPRLRIGIGSPSVRVACAQRNRTTSDKNTISHVLGKFSPSETQLMSEVIQLAVDAVELSLRQGVEKAMSLYNGRAVSPLLCD